MPIFHVASIIMVLLGLALMIWAGSNSLNLQRQVPVELKNRWGLLTALILFFHFGYLGFVVILINGFIIPLELWSAGIMLVGALFVLLFVKLGELTTLKMNEGVWQWSNANNELLEVNKTLQDEVAEKERISEKLRSSKAHLENIFNYSIPLCITSYDHVVIEANDAYKNIFGELKGSNAKCYESRPGPSCRSPQCPMVKISEGEAEVVCESIKIEPDGSKRHFMVTARPFVEYDGQVTGIIESFQDVTELKKAETALAQEMARAQKLESVGLLAGGIAHDFNNILTVIMNNLALTRISIDDKEKFLKRLDSSEDAVLKAKELTGQLLTFAKGGAPIRKVMPIGKMLKEAVEFVLHGSNVKCKFDIADDLWAVDYDMGQIQQVVGNLVINADQAMETGAVLKVSAENRLLDENNDDFLGAGKYVKICFQDEGCGIAEDDIPKLFDPYFTTKSSGSGLGLAMVYSIVNRHGGYITVESEIGKGTLFTVFLPATDRMDEEEISEPAPDNEEQTHSMAKGKRILVMDDDREINQLIKEFLEAEGFEVECTFDGQSAVEKYEKSFSSGKGFDCVLMDLTVPGGMGGKDAFDLIKGIDPSAKGVVSSGYSNDPVMADHKAFGFSEIAVKPYKAERLISKIYQVISAS